MVPGDEANEEFVRFAKAIPKESLPAVAVILNDKVREHARSISRDTDLKLEEALERFFGMVSADTGRNAPHSDSSMYFTNMVKAWVKASRPQRTFLLETYFFLHRSSGRDIAIAIDKEIFGRIYFDQFGHPLHQADQDLLSDQANETGSIPAFEAVVQALPAAASAPTWASKAQLAWETARNEVTIPPYMSFTRRYPATAEAKQAELHIRDLKLWEAIPQSNPFAIREFLETGLFPALAYHARKALDDAKGQYISENVARIRSVMLSSQEPTSALGWFTMLGTGYLFLAFFFGAIVVLGQAAYATVTHPVWPFAQATPAISGFADDALQGRFGNALRAMDINTANFPSGETVAIVLQAAGVFIAYGAIAFFIIGRIARMIEEDLAPRHQAQIQEIEAYYADKVAGL
ncbi:hypothetical protein J3E64_002690 [Sphingobium sp. OAS761]|uniref:hypothetical protein n=1 Tax=Sphingobium sp. OAS761 TaxID=2817901 RepID=UPI00209D70E3|nr:hypothetical protein [Sphingobium sp. OAS761]MCP1470993.1 hypothetical protein [Sphingobium sp. OAS761]